MSDNTQKRGLQDRLRINAEEDYELDYVAEEAGVSREAVKKAIEEVGNNRDKVMEYLKKGKQ